MLDVSLVLSIKNQVSSGKFEILDTGYWMLDAYRVNKLPDCLATKHRARDVFGIE